jgi:hypothetical protein
LDFGMRVAGKSQDEWATDAYLLASSTKCVGEYGLGKAPELVI